MAWIDTTKLPDISQRNEPMELIGQVIGTAGTAPYVHLQLEMAKRLFGDTMPILVANDGDDEQSRAIGELAESYGAEFICWPKKGHAYGDMRIFKESMEWAKRLKLDVVAKFSRRFIPLVSWRHGLQYLMAFNTDACFFTRKHLDSNGGLFRTDAIAYRLRLLDNPRVNETLDEIFAGDGTRALNVETMFESFSRVTGGWVLWDLLGPNFYKPWTKAMQWRGLLPYHYGDLSRQLDLPYSDIDFLPASAVVMEQTRESLAEAIERRHPAIAGIAQAIQLDAGPLTVNPDAAVLAASPDAPLTVNP